MEKDQGRMPQGRGSVSMGTRPGSLGRAPERGHAPCDRDSRQDRRGEQSDDRWRTAALEDSRDEGADRLNWRRTKRISEAPLPCSETGFLEHLFRRMLLEGPLVGGLQRIETSSRVGGGPVCEHPPEVFGRIGLGRLALGDWAWEGDSAEAAPLADREPRSGPRSRPRRVTGSIQAGRNRS